jgi:hypothetical protein
MTSAFSITNILKFKSLLLCDLNKNQSEAKNKHNTKNVVILFIANHTTIQTGKDNSKKAGGNKHIITLRLQTAIVVGKAVWAGYRYYQSAKNASMAVQAAAHIGGAASLAGTSYTAAKTFGP